MTKGYRVFKSCDNCKKQTKLNWYVRGQNLCFSCYRNEVKMIRKTKFLLIDEELKKEIDKETIKYYNHKYYLKRKLNKKSNSDEKKTKTEKNSNLLLPNSLEKDI